MMGSTPGIVTQRKPKRMALDDAQLASMKFGGPIVIESGQQDAGNTISANVLRPGNVLIKKAGSAKFVVANDYENADQGSVAEITSEEAPDDDWEGKTLSLFRNGVLVAEVALGAEDDTTAEVVAALNGDQAFAANAIASGTNGNRLVITDILGRGDALRVEFPLATAYANEFDDASSYAEDEGELPDVRVIGEEVSMLDANGNAQDALCGFNFIAGHFKVAQLITGGAAGIPASAKGVLKARGSTFVA